MRLVTCLALVAGAAAFVAAPAAPAALTVVHGRNDKRTKKGKIYAGSNGNSRRPKKSGDGPVDPYLTLREWGSRQDPPMSVEEVVAMKVASKKKVEVSRESILDAVTPF